MRLWDDLWLAKYYYLTGDHRLSLLHYYEATTSLSDAAAPFYVAVAPNCLWIRTCTSWRR